MTKYTQSQKQSIYNWRTKNKEKFNEYQRQLERKRYENIKDEKSKKALERYYNNKEIKAIMNILIN